MRVSFTRRLVAVAVLLAAAGIADAALRTVEEAYELGLAQVTLPATETGQLAVRRCRGCKTEILQVNAATRYFIRPSAAPVALAETRKAAAKAAGRPKASVYVYYDPKTRTVRRLVLAP